MALDLEDLAFPASFRAIDEAGEPGCDLAVNQAFLDFYGLSELPASWTGFLDDRGGNPDDLDRQVAATTAPVDRQLHWQGHTHALAKSPVRRDGRVVGVLTVLPAATEERWRSSWLERLVDVAAMPTVATASKLAFAVVDDALGLDRGALLRFDGQMVDVLSLIHISEPTRLQ